jgi:hypothetical protein
MGRNLNGNITDSQDFTVEGATYCVSFELFTGSYYPEIVDIDILRYAPDGSLMKGFLPDREVQSEIEEGIINNYLSGEYR